jgi:ribosomal protein S18 acetylase RimI-like enzyme
MKSEESIVTGGSHPEGSVMIRPWERGDLENVRRITWETWLATYASFIPESDLRWYLDKQYTVQALGELMLSVHFRGLLAVEQENALGYAKVQFHADDRRCYLSSLYVVPTAQGKGVGRQLLERAESIAREFGVDEIWLGVMVQNTQALDWYTRLGFMFVREEPFVMGNTTVRHRIGYRPIHAQESLS